MLAALGGRIKVVVELVRAKANLDQQDNVSIYKSLDLYIHVYKLIRESVDSLCTDGTDACTM